MKRLALLAAATLLAPALAHADRRADAPVIAPADVVTPVIGGTDAPVGKWPDLTGIIFTYGGGDSIDCTGTLIAPSLVLTAGHCVDADLTKVVIGAPARSRMAEGEVIAVTERLEHPNSWRTYDVAVLRLATPSTREPRTIATGWARHDITNGATAALVGYGAVDRNGSRIVDAVQEATSTITDAGCTTSQGCNGGVRPDGELGAGGGGIDTCPGDSGGPLYLVTDYGTFLAGVTSRGYNDNQYYCSEGGIYVRPDKLVDWVETSTGVELATGPGPRAELLVVETGSRGAVRVDAGDPHPGTTHTFAIVTPPVHGTAEIAADGTLTYTPEAGYLGDDVLTVEATDAANPQRTATGKIAVEVVEEIGGCGCQSSGAPVGTGAPLLLAALALLRRRR